MITAQVESFEATIPELRPLTEAHYDEISLHKAEGFPLDPQWDVYITRERAGMVLFVTLRADGVLVGYIIAFIAPGLHYRTCLTCTPDIFFIHPAHRGGTGALRLFREAQRELERRGVRLWVIAEKLHKPMGRMLTAMGFEAIETNYSKWLGAK